MMVTGGQAAKNTARYPLNLPSAGLIANGIRTSAAPAADTPQGDHHGLESVITMRGISSTVNLMRCGTFRSVFRGNLGFFASAGAFAGKYSA